MHVVIGHKLENFHKTIFLVFEKILKNFEIFRKINQFLIEISILIFDFLEDTKCICNIILSVCAPGDLNKVENFHKTIIFVFEKILKYFEIFRKINQFLIEICILT